MKIIFRSKISLLSLLLYMCLCLYLRLSVVMCLLLCLCISLLTCLCLLSLFLHMSMSLSHSMLLHLSLPLSLLQYMSLSSLFMHACNCERLLSSSSVDGLISSSCMFLYSMSLYAHVSCHLWQVYAQRRRLVINIGGQKFGSQLLGGQKFRENIFSDYILKIILKTILLFSKISDDISFF